MIRDFASADEAAQALASDIVDALRAALVARPAASLVVPGGRSPIVLFEKLSRTKLDWSRVIVTLADERWVAISSPDSNEALVRSRLLTGEAATATMVGLKTDDGDPHAALAEVEDRIRPLPRPFDVTLLGMGEDGHFASLFPGAPGVDAALDPQGRSLVAAIDPPAAGHHRISMTLACLLDSRRILLTIPGATKAGVFARARAGASPAELPIAAIVRQTRIPLDVYRSP